MVKTVSEKRSIIISMGVHVAIDVMKVLNVVGWRHPNSLAPNCNRQVVIRQGLSQSIWVRGLWPGSGQLRGKSSTRSSELDRFSLLSLEVCWFVSLWVVTIIVLQRNVMMAGQVEGAMLL